MKSLSKTLLAVVFISVASISSYFFLVQHFTKQEALQTEKTAAFFARTIDDALRRLEHLPFVISQYSAVVDALVDNDGKQINSLLKSFADRAVADHIFLMDLNGKTIAASNYESLDSFVGNYYTFRPYFSDAIIGETGRFYAIGATTGEPGYFVSAPVYDRFGNIFGVIVVKTGLQSLNNAWRESGVQILVSNIDTVVVLASEPDNQFQTLRPLSTHARLNLENAQQFGNQQLRPLDWQVGDNGQVKLNGKEYLLAQVQIEQEDWTLHLLTSLSGIRQRATLMIAGVLTLLFGVIVAITGFRSIRLKRALGKSNTDRIRLTQEIEVRRAAETDLKVAQDELERASRLAALGQLSASITHELGQPISAMRNYLTAEEIVTDATPNSLNPLLSRLVDRMQNINDQLRSFATLSAREASIFDLRRASDAAVELVAHGVAAANIVLIKRYTDRPVNVVGNQQQVEQVLINLLRNAMDAVTTQNMREITVTVDITDDKAFVRVTDTGAGLEGRTMADLEEPFMTTKPSGQGMGLGLAISAQIAKDMKGRIEAHDTLKGGAEFTLWLPSSGDQP
ncbi:MAG: GHKL domain-containing protein [Rhodobacteraceae bacterium]|nr:GHKL domain-containing protein [Paracoccaceae bacterium]